MKAKVSRGSGFRGALNYVFDLGPQATHLKQAELVGGNMAGHEPPGLVREFSVTRQLRPDITRPVWHCSLALPAGERLENAKWNEIAEAFVARMGFSAYTPWIAVRHQDTDYDHIHIVASRVSMDGKVWLGQWEARKAIAATQALERTHGLALTPGLGDVRAERKQLTSNEIQMGVRTGQEPPRLALQRLVDEIARTKPSSLEFAEKLQCAGVEVRANIASGTGRMNGFSFSYQGIPFKGSDLGKAYTWQSLQKRGITYEQTRDREGLTQLVRPTITDSPERGEPAKSSELVAGFPPGVAGRDRDGSHDHHRAAPELETASGQVSDGIRRSDSPPTPDPRRLDRGNGLEGDESLRGESTIVGSDVERGQPERAADRPTPADDVQRRGGAEERSRGIGGATPADLASNAHAHPGLNPHRLASAWWKTHFRALSAKPRAATANGEFRASGVEQGDAARTSSAQGDSQPIRAIDPTPYLLSKGYSVTREGPAELSVKALGREIYRLTREKNGHWIARKLGKLVGDTIQLVRRLEQRGGYAEALYRLTKGPTLTQQPPNSERLAREARESRQAEADRIHAAAEQRIQAELDRQAAAERQSEQRQTEADYQVAADWVREEQAREAEKEAAPAPAPEQDAQRPVPPRRILEPGDAARLAELRRQAKERDRPQRPDRDRGHSIGM